MRSKTIMIVLLAMACGLHAADTSDTKVTMGVGLGFHINQIVDGSPIREYRPNPQAGTDATWMDKKVFPKMTTTIYTRAVIQEKLSIFLRLQTGIKYTYTGFDKEDIKPQRKGVEGSNQAYATYHFNTVNDPKSSTLKIGMFDYYYSPQSRTFGEYLFTTGTYPGTITSGDSIVEVTGMQFGGFLPALLRHDLFLAVHMVAPPAFDISPVYMASIRQPAFQIAAGVMLDRLFQNRARISRPKEYKSGTDFIQTAYYDKTTGDTTWYSKAGIKLVGRGCFDIKKIIPMPRLGDEDLKLYAEAALLGAKNYDGYYEKITERVPVMAGLNLPAFKLLDYLSLEMQYYGSPWRNDGLYNHASAPFYDFDWDDHKVNFIWDPKAARKDSRNRHKTDNIKWSAVATKTISRTTLSLKAASDHWDNNFYSPTEWYWGFSFLASF